MVVYQELIHEPRIIPLDGRPRIPGSIRQFLGDSRGHWEGDTLVVESIDFTTDSWIGIYGWFHSDQMKVTERISRVGDTLRYQATVEDPEVFTRPWKISMPLYRRVERNAQLLEFKCVEFAEEMLYGHLRKRY